MKSSTMPWIWGGRVRDLSSGLGSMIGDAALRRQCSLPRPSLPVRHVAHC